MRSSNVSVNCLHPGVIDTKLLRIGWGMGGSPVEHGAETSIYLAASGEVEGVTAKYFVSSRIAGPAPICGDKSVQERLWQESAGLCGFDY